MNFITIIVYIIMLSGAYWIGYSDGKHKELGRLFKKLADKIRRWNSDK